MSVSRYDRAFKDIKKQLECIREVNSYQNNSVAFIHWFLSQQCELCDQDIAEAIIDGNGDLGIDAVLVDEENESITVMQFKFPSSSKSIGNEIKQDAILKTWNGFETLISNGIKYKGKNQRFKEIKEQTRELNIYNFKLWFVSFDKGIVAQDNLDIIEEKTKAFRESTGNEIEVSCYNRDEISRLYGRTTRTSSVKIELNYKQMPFAYETDKRNFKSFVGLVQGSDLVNSISADIVSIFDENIRLYENGSRVNVGINRTATSEDQSYMFYFYNNGVVFICDKYKNSTGNNKIELEGVSIVNGCQTLNVLYDAKAKNALKDDVYVLVRVFVIDDYNERMNITEYLNSQNPIKSSYFVANHPTIKKLQSQLLDKGYFLERQNNEYAFRAKYGDGSITKKIVLQVDKAVQYYVGYWINDFASAAKSGKGELFDKSKIDNVLSEIDANKVIEAVDAYDRISEVLTMYRKMRRNHSKTEFAEFMHLSATDVINHFDEYRYMNTGDILLLNAFSNLKLQYHKLKLNVNSSEEVICDAIRIVRDIIKEEENGNPAQLTKSKSVFNKVQLRISELHQRYD